MSSLSLSRLPRPYQFLLLAVVLAALLWVAVLNSLLNSSSSTPEASVATHPTLFLHRHAPLVVHHAAPAVTAPEHAKTAPSVRSRHHSAVSSRHHAAPVTHRTAVHRSGHRAATAPATHTPAATHHGAVTHAAHHAVSAPAGHRSPAPAAARPTTHTVTHTAHAAPVSPSHHAASTTKPAASAPKPVAPAPARAVSVSDEIESQLGAGKLVLVLFWEPKAAVDQYVRQQVSSAAGAFHSRVAVHYVLPTQVGELGTWTDKVLVAETPTLLMITPARQVSAFAGFSDEASVTQNIDRLLGLPYTPTVKKAAAPKSAGKAKKSGHSARRGH